MLFHLKNAKKLKSGVDSSDLRADFLGLEISMFSTALKQFNMVTQAPTFGCFQKYGKTPKSSICSHRVWNHYFHHPFWGTSIFGNTHLLRMNILPLLISMFCLPSTWGSRPLVDAARCGERGVFGQRRVVLHGVGRVGDECCKLRKVTCGEVFFWNWWQTLGLRREQNFQQNVAICSWGRGQNSIVDPFDDVVSLNMVFDQLIGVPSTMQVGCNVLSSTSFSWQTSTWEIASIAAAMLVSWQHLHYRLVQQIPPYTAGNTPYKLQL